MSNESTFDVRPIQAGDVEAIRAFFARIGDGDKTFFKEDVDDAETVTQWTTDHRGHRLLAFDGIDVVGYLAVIPGVGWSDHVGELRLVVDPTRRRSGLGRRLARLGLVEALQMDLQKVIVEVVTDQVATIQLFDSLGFEGEALLRDHVRNRDGEFRDLIVLAHAAQETWELMSAAGIDDAVGQ